jgi:hypothetical protein
MTTMGCPYPEHHQSGGTSPLLLVVAGVLVAGVVAAAAALVADVVTVLLWSAVGLVVVMGAGVVWLVRRHAPVSTWSFYGEARVVEARRQAALPAPVRRGVGGRVVAGVVLPAADRGKVRT